MKSLVPTGEMTLGPFFPPEFAAGANDLTMLEGRRVRGEAIAISGRVVQADGQALDNLVLEIWQADADGRYDSADFLGWGRAATDRDGVYRFSTIRPGKAEGRAPHINFLILYSGLMRQLHTVMFFEDSDDPVLNAVQDKASLIARRVNKGYVFDIRLRGEGETPFFDD